MEGVTTESLRSSAPKWSLAGDDTLLNILQCTHQRIISKCQDVNSKLENMASALDDATINLQNVNNKFMALSNSQFIESRVYDDDEELVEDTRPAQEPPQQPKDHLCVIKSSLAILERTHETAEIMDDSDSDSDTQISVVLKPKDMYSQRPLPHVIGTLAWKNKWHAGLIVEDSDTDSTTSKHDAGELDQYSDSESDVELPRRVEEPTMSEASSSRPSSRREAAPAQTPADVAAELARRLGGTQPVNQEPEEFTPPVPSTNKVYKPERPAASNIFFDEPPELSDGSQSEDDDIFAEINKNKPYTKRNVTENNPADDLFSFDKPVEQGDIFSDFAQQAKPSKQKSTLFEDEHEPDLFAETKQEVQNNNNVEKDEMNTKKPVGGISLFGTNKGAESIGAAILKRNRRKSSTSGDESGSDAQKQEKPTVVPKNIEESAKESVKSQNVGELDDKSLKKEKDLFEDLFAKPKVEKKVQKIQEPVKEKAKDKKDIADLFKDNIFDDIDDIFTSDVKIPPKESNQKSIFDDDDDLFADIPVKPKNLATNSKENQKPNKSIFDGDDELFSDVKTNGNKKSLNNNIENDKSISRNLESHKAEEFHDQSIEHPNESSVVSNVETIVKTTEKVERNLHDDSPQNVKSDKPTLKSKGIFDSDSDDDIFASISKTKRENTFKDNVAKTKVDDTNMFNQNANPKLLATDNLKVSDKSNLLKSPSLFEDDEIEDLFVNTNKRDTIPISKDIKAADIKTIPPQAINETIAKEITSGEIKSNVDSQINTDLTIPNSNSVEIEKDSSKQTVTLQTTSDGNSLKDDIFSTPTNVSKVKDVKSNEPIATDFIESSQEVKPKVETKNDNATAQFDETKNINIQPEILETNASIEDSNHSIFDDFSDPVKENLPLTVEQKRPISKKPNIFDEIFSEPPAFEKPTEPKKSKNVNALFDDDSDDESLFFKKNDVISDEKPEMFTSNANFDIFVSEPPAIDVDFTTKTNKNLVTEEDNKFRVHENEDIFSSVPKLEENKPNLDRSTDSCNSLYKTQVEHNIDTIVTKTDLFADKTSDVSLEDNPENSILNIYENEDLFNIPEENKNADGHFEVKGKLSSFSKELTDSDDDLFSGLPKPNVPVTSQVSEQSKLDIISPKETEQNKIKSMADVTEDEFRDMFKTKQSSKKENEKKIGKINTKNFNINVNALIPGASPKKVPKDTQIQESEPKMVKILPTNDETDNQPKAGSDIVQNQTSNVTENTTKSVAFEDKPDSGVLDNNLSKQRAKIQVKRRPSSRRARHEAVRKSAIDFDDTDNSNSFDEPVKRKNDNERVETNEDDQNVFKAEKIDRESVIESNANKIIDINTPTNSKIDNNDRNNPEKQDVNTETILNKTNDQKSTTKVVYILNDEDIFNTNESDIFAKNTLNNDNNTVPKTENDNKHILVKNDMNDIFGSKTVENSDDIFKNMGVNTLGKSYNTVQSTETDKNDTANSTEATKSVKIEDKKNYTNENNEKRSSQNAKSLFSDSDEELFKKTRNSDKKVSIFDSDSEEDLFSGQKRTEKQSKEKKNQEVREKKVKTSLFDDDDDDDDDLFGDKKVKSEPQQSIPSTSKETPKTASKPVEPVFDDPLSMFDD